MRRRALLLLGIPVALVLLAVGATWFYFNVISDDAPPPLTLESDESTGTTAGAGTAVDPGSLTGAWRPTPASEVRYRVDEVAFGQSRAAVGGTNAVTGVLRLDATQVSEASFAVDMTTVSSDESRRDRQFHGRIMDTANHPEATFRLTSPIRLEEIPEGDTIATYDAAGELSLRGTTRPVTFPLKAQREGAAIKANGSIPITFAEWNIPNPSFGPVSTEDHGELEFLLVFEKGS